MGLGVFRDRLVSGIHLRSIRQRESQDKQTGNDFPPHPQPFSPEYLGRREPELTWQVTMKFHLLNTVSSGQPWGPSRLC